MDMGPEFQPFMYKYNTIIIPSLRRRLQKWNFFHSNDSILDHVPIQHARHNLFAAPMC